MKYTREFHVYTAMTPTGNPIKKTIHTEYISSIEASYGGVEHNQCIINTEGQRLTVNEPYSTVKTWYEETRWAWDNKGGAG